MSTESKVTAIIVTYAPSKAILSDCIDSLRSQTPPVELIIIDNFSPSDPNHEIARSFESESVRVIQSDRNLGFGGAVNTALKLVDTPFVLISNFDIVYDPKYVESALTALEKENGDTVGIAGKTLFYPPDGDKSWPGTGPGDKEKSLGSGTGAVIDNTGTLVNGLMLAYNRGVGQIDIGQYDKPENDRNPMGACFAAFFARKSAFVPISAGGVGLLDTGFFMYYEDIDWCYRANLLGKRIIYNPGGVAWHHHSLTTRDKSLFFKYHLIQRNLYRTIIKNMRFRTFVKLWLLHARFHIRRARVERQFLPVTFRILAETPAYLPAGLIKRIPIQNRRKISDTDIVNLSIGEEGHLDDISLRPKEDLSNPTASLERLQRFFPENPANKLIAPLKKAVSEGISEGIADEILRSAEIDCPALVPLLKRIISKSKVL